MSAALRLASLATAGLAEAVCQQTRQAVDAWALRWGFDSMQVEIEAVACDQEQRAAWSDVAGNVSGCRLSAAELPAASSFWPQPLRAAVIRALYGEAGASASSLRSDGLAAQSADHLIADLQAVLAQTWHVENWRAADSEPAPLKRWDAPVRLRLRLLGQEILAMLPAGRFGRPPQVSVANPNQAAARRAMESLPTTLTLQMGQADLSMAELAGLQVGDVLVLDSLVREPLQLQMQGGAPLLRVHLGRQGPRRAAQLAAASHS